MAVQLDNFYEKWERAERKFWEEFFAEEDEEDDKDGEQSEEGD